MLSWKSACLTGTGVLPAEAMERLGMVAPVCKLRARKAEAREAMGLTGGPAEPDLQVPGQRECFKKQGGCLLRSNNQDYCLVYTVELK